VDHLACFVLAAVEEIEQKVETLPSQRRNHARQGSRKRKTSPRFARDTAADEPLTESLVSRRGTMVRGVDDDAIRALVTRLARPHPSGGEVVERAAILAEGADFAAVMTWITAHAGTPEAVSAAPKRGLHGSRVNDGGEARPRTPLRFVLPAGALTDPSRHTPATSL
jgi:hypothetical protein